MGATLALGSKAFISSLSLTDDFLNLYFLSQQEVAGLGGGLVRGMGSVPLYPYPLNRELCAVDQQ